MGGGGAADRDADRPVAGLEQLVHQPHPVRVLQQEVPARLHGHPEVGRVLWQAALLRDRRDHVVVDVDAQVVVLREQQLVDEAHLPQRPRAPGQQRVVHLQPQGGRVTFEGTGVERRSCDDEPRALPLSSYPSDGGQAELTLTYRCSFQRFELKRYEKHAKGPLCPLFAHTHSALSSIYNADIAKRDGMAWARERR